MSELSSAQLAFLEDARADGCKVSTFYYGRRQVGVVEIPPRVTLDSFTGIRVAGDDPRLIHDWSIEWEAFKNALRGREQKTT